MRLSFFREHFRKDKFFTSSDLLKHVPGWTWTSASTYWSKQFEPFLTRVPPIVRGKNTQSTQQWRVTDVFLIVGTWAKFRRHVSQKRRLTFEYTHTAYKTVLIFEFFLPLTNETVLRNALDALFYRDALQKKLLALGLAALKSQFEQKSEESDNAYLDRLIGWLGKHFRGYSIGHVSGRFRAEDEPRTMQDAAGTQERGGRYLIDETTAVTRFIFPCENRTEALTVSWFFHRLFVESVSQVAGEAEIWMIESGIGDPQLHIWRGEREDD
ncbi:MAG TPA: hypothetical protein VFT39_12445 [Vicinamibacterales bacterium]|nr:hypothetical protein [Vicinamibacterales bacterium]